VYGKKSVPHNWYVTLIGLACKNSILIIAFARHCKTRENRFAQRLKPVVSFSPILMTSLTFAFGVLPLMIAAGAGAN
jgi:multidrug efflux pump subunit AcrB